MGAAPRPQDGLQYVLDDGKALSKSSFKALSKALTQLESDTGYHLNVVTLRKLLSDPDAFTYADKVLESWYPTREEGDKKGVLLDHLGPGGRRDRGAGLPLGGGRRRPGRGHHREHRQPGGAGKVERNHRVERRAHGPRAPRGAGQGGAPARQKARPSDRPPAVVGRRGSPTPPPPPPPPNPPLFKKKKKKKKKK